MQARAASRPGLCAIAPGRRAGAPPLWQLARSFPVTGPQPLSWVRKTPWGRAQQPTPVFLPGESQGWGSLVGCCLWGRTESDMTEAT